MSDSTGQCGKRQYRCLARLLLACLLLPGAAPAQVLLEGESTTVNQQAVSETLSRASSRKWAEISADEARYNSPQAQAERQRQNEQYQAEERRKKEAACARARAGGDTLGKLWYC